MLIGLIEKKMTSPLHLTADKWKKKEQMFLKMKRSIPSENLTLILVYLPRFRFRPGESKVKVG